MILFHLVNNIAVEKYAGGAELFSIRLLENFPDDIERHLVVIWKCGTETEKEIIANLHGKIIVHFLGDYNKKIKSFLPVIKKFFLLVKKFRPSIIHSHSELPDVMGLLAKITYFRKLSFIRTMHTDNQWQKSIVFECLFGKILLPIFCDREIAISEMTKEKLDNRRIVKLTKNKSKIIYNGINESLLIQKYKIRDKRLLIVNKKEKIKLISTGRLTEQKGYSYLIEAISMVSRDLEVILYIFGEGNQRNELEKLIEKLNLSDKVKLLGHEIDVCSFYNEFDIFISSSLYEGFPTVILESMVLNLPVIATNVSGSRELVINKKTGLLIPPKNSLAISNAIKYFVSNYDEALEYAANAKKFVSQFRIENIVSEYLNIYKDLIDEN